MKYTITMKVDPQVNPNQVGELLRYRFFDQNDIEKGYLVGCYDTCKLNKDVKELPNEYDLCPDDIDDWFWICATADNIKMRYDVSDGGNGLQFIFKDGSCLINNDCKKDYNWKFIAPKKKFERKKKK